MAVMKKYEYHRDNNPAFCILPFSQSHINTDGTVHVCCVGDWDHALSRNVSKENILDIWRGEKYQKIRRISASSQKGYFKNGSWSKFRPPRWISWLC